MRRTPAVLLVLGLLAAVAPRLAAQGDVATLIARGRQYLEDFKVDSSVIVLERALAPGAGATTAQRVRAFVLYGIAQLSQGNASVARGAFRSALQLNPTERVDSLVPLEPDNLLREFNGERAAVAPVVAAPAAAQRLLVAAELPRDTVLAAQGNLLPITPRPSRRARGIVTVSPADAPAVILWGDTLPAGASGALGWNLRGRDGALVAPGRYAVRVTAVDSAGEESSPVQRVVLVDRMPADTAPIPAPLEPDAFRPETLRTRGGSISSVLVGGALAAVTAAVLPTALGRTELNSGRSGDGTAYVAAGTLAVAGIVGFVAGERARYAPENVQFNEELRATDVQERRRLVAANAEARERAPLRVRLEGGP